MATFPMRGYFKLCNLCGGEFGGLPGARRYIWHLRWTGCGTYYGHDQDRTAEHFQKWLWSITGQERELVGGEWEQLRGGK